MKVSLFIQVPGQPYWRGLSFPYSEGEMKDPENKVGVRGELKIHCEYK